MNLWRPTIWTPMSEQRRRARRGQYWRRRLFDPLRFAAGDVLLDTSGNVILDASGNVMLSDGAGDDCCCGGIDPCAYCTGGGADTLDLSFLDVVACDGCATRVYGSTTLTALSLSDYTLPRILPCAWELTQSPLVDATGGYYTTSDCTGTFYPFDSMVIRVQKTDVNVMAVWAFLYPSTGPMAGDSFSVFSANPLTADYECFPAGAISNALSVSDCSDLINRTVGYDGTVVIS